MSEYTGEGLRRVLLLQLDRWLLSAGILFAVFAALVGGSRLGLSPIAVVLEQHDGAQMLFTAFVGAIITGTTLVVTINQLVLSQELGAVGDQVDRMRASMDFRKKVEDAVNGGVISPEPAGFLVELLEGIEAEASQLAATTRDTDVQTYAEDLGELADSVASDLEDEQFGTFGVIWAALGFEYSRYLIEARRLAGSELEQETSDRLETVIELLTLYGPAREHLKTLYFQWALIDLSRALLYISVPALVVIGTLVMYLEPGALTGTTAGIDHLVWVVSAGFMVGIAPFVVFIAHILRIATVAKRTLAMGPFILREWE